ncbi:MULTISPECIES: folylpolyglutamate synthase/dihydrofolate synthase family protein [unclassified Leptolyngbya]|uniref:bifunctional folylpolyglutamate synthase/dihydrofolate synthase n=1 Tax=unclassified Leptolyngbya TaxID=2650499 RepID=UPI00168752D8|nr:MULTISPECIES: folylpolyglutamate synthase/dihydrofolate synthase family protein [unclassified Leptolyngbya]MBD1911046.1 bifunctional folylpolyglutamate synthase/dihydrofolate synthase [Leptolyngbya sp. FACHB-8]MBD2158288.1 bifunctional folylpolyglutamate synthase/dihydrofolate synthase [Leptolyngbya sp. FACHB-16]
MNPSDADVPLPQAIAQSSAVDTLLNAFTHFGVELGLERIERLLTALGNPQRRVPVIHVAGSNGKGSVCAYLSAVLTHAGYRVGRYTSPHLVDWTERICLNERAIAPETLTTLLEQVIAAIDPAHSSPTQFEIITAAAWLYFAQEQVDVAVMEVGLGGRLDATNVCDRPLVSVITSLSREHWQRLGPTLADITREKAGILKAGCPAVIAPQPEEAMAVLRSRSAELACSVTWVEPSIAIGEGWALWNGAGDASPEGLPGLKYQVPLGGGHQLINSAVAIAALRLLQKQGWALDDLHILEGLAKTRWPGRMQWIQWSADGSLKNQRPLLIDGAHNPAGAEMLRRYVDGAALSRPLSWVMGMIANKDHGDVFRALLRENDSCSETMGDRLHLVPVPDHITADVGELTALAKQICPDVDCTAHPDVFSGLEAAYANNPDGTVILCGSLYLIGDFFKRAGIH